MRRREFLGFLGGAAMAWPVVARAQQPERMRRIGILLAAADCGTFLAVLQQDYALEPISELLQYEMVIAEG